MTNPRPPKRQRMLSSTAALPEMVNGFSVLPITIPSTIPSAPSAVHILYVRKHEEPVRQSALPTTDPSRILFVANIPIDSTKETLRGLFASLGGRLEQVRIHRQGEEDSEHREPDEFIFPNVWDKQLCPSGSTAHITFPNPEDVTKVLKTISKERRNHNGAIREWGVGVDLSSSSLGLQRNPPPLKRTDNPGYLTHYKLTYPAKNSLQSLVDTAITRFDTTEAARMLSLKRLRSEPDEDGFITVTRKQRDDFIAPPPEKKKPNKAVDLEDFYKFQRREKREKQMEELRRKFEEDKIKVEWAKQARKFKPF